MSVLTVVLDDDPTGSQCAAGVVVALDLSSERLTRLVQKGDSFFAVTNIRSMPEQDSRALLRRIRRDVESAARQAGTRVRFVLRGDSTLRGHLAAEIETLAAPETRIILVPAFPEAGRVTHNGVHRVRVDQTWLNAADTEFAGDPVFGFAERNLADFVTRRLAGRPVVSMDADHFGDALLLSDPATVLIPDVVSDADLDTVHRGIEEAAEAGIDVLVRCASPLAARLAGRLRSALLEPLTPRPGGRLLVVCGSHTTAASQQLAALAPAAGVPILIDTDTAMRSSDAAADRAADALKARLMEYPSALLATERVRGSRHGTLADGARVMAALTTTVSAVAGDVDCVISKGGITSAEVAQFGLGCGQATVVGQLLVGVSLWQLDLLDGRPMPYVVVPGNIGDHDTLVTLAAAVGFGWWVHAR